MKSIKETTHTVIIRIWLEPREMKDAEPIWGGVIEIVDDSKQVYFIKLNQVVAYMVSIIEALGQNFKADIMIL